MKISRRTKNKSAEKSENEKFFPTRILTTELSSLRAEKKTFLRRKSENLQRTFFLWENVSFVRVSRFMYALNNESEFDDHSRIQNISEISSKCSAVKCRMPEQPPTMNFIGHVAISLNWKTSWKNSIRKFSLLPACDEMCSEMKKWERAKKKLSQKKKSISVRITLNASRCLFSNYLLWFLSTNVPREHNETHWMVKKLIKQNIFVFDHQKDLILEKTFAELFSSQCYKLQIRWTFTESKQHRMRMKTNRM